MYKSSITINSLVYDLETIDNEIFIASMSVDSFYNSLDFSSRLKLAKIAMMENDRFVDRQLVAND